MSVSFMSSKLYGIPWLQQTRQLCSQYTLPEWISRDNCTLLCINTQTVLLRLRDFWHIQVSTYGDSPWIFYAMHLYPCDFLDGLYLFPSYSPHQADTKIFTPRWWFFPNQIYFPSYHVPISWESVYRNNVWIAGPVSCITFAIFSF